jgi:hypothetical protein
MRGLDNNSDIRLNSLDHRVTPLFPQKKSPDFRRDHPSIQLRDHPSPFEALRGQLRDHKHQN